MHDSGKRQEFTTGAVRDTAEGKPRIDLISPFAEARLGAWSALGAAKYSPRNWEAGMPFSRILASLCRHLNAYRAGDRSEDHLAAVMWNAMALAHGEEMVKRGVWDGALADLPDYGDAPRPAEASTLFASEGFPGMADDRARIPAGDSALFSWGYPGPAGTLERLCTKCKHSQVSIVDEPCAACRLDITHPAWVYEAASV